MADTLPNLIRWGIPQAARERLWPGIGRDLFALEVWAATVEAPPGEEMGT